MSTIKAIKKRKQELEAVGDTSTVPAAPSATTLPPAVKPEDDDDLLSPAAIEREYQRQKAAKRKRGWLWGGGK